MRSNKFRLIVASINVPLRIIQYLIQISYLEVTKIRKSLSTLEYVMQRNTNTHQDINISYVCIIDEKKKQDTFIARFKLNDKVG